MVEQKNDLESAHRFRYFSRTDSSAPICRSNLLMDLK